EVKLARHGQGMVLAGLFPQAVTEGEQGGSRGLARAGGDQQIDATGEAAAVDENLVIAGEALAALHHGEGEVAAGKQVVGRLGIEDHGEDFAMTTQGRTAQKLEDANLDLSRAQPP